MALSAEDLADLRRWAICGAVIVFAHGAIAAGMVTWHESIEPAEPAAAIVIEPPAPEVKPETPQRQEPRRPVPTTSAPQAIPHQTAAIPAAPTQGRITPNNSNAVPTWKTQIVALLERNKRYPEAAQSRREQGIAQVFFSLDRQGRVIDSRVVRSSGARA